MLVGTDWRGTSFHIGSTIIYPSRHSSSVWMTEAVIEEMRFTGDRLSALIVKRTRTTSCMPIVKDTVKLTNLSKIIVIAPPLRSKSQRDWNAVRSGMKS